MDDKGYRRLDIYRRAHKIAVDVHRMTLQLPKLEMFEEGSQIRRASKSVAAQIVEGYCLRKNKKEFVQFLNRAHASAHETIEHLDLLFETGSLVDAELYRQLHGECEILCKMVFRFMESVLQGHDVPGFIKEDEPDYHTSATSHPTSGI